MQNTRFLTSLDAFTVFVATLFMSCIFSCRHKHDVLLFPPYTSQSHTACFAHGDGDFSVPHLSTQGHESMSTFAHTVHETLLAGWLVVTMMKTHTQTRTEYTD